MIPYKRLLQVHEILKPEEQKIPIINNEEDLI